MCTRTLSGSLSRTAGTCRYSEAGLLRFRATTSTTHPADTPHQRSPAGGGSDIKHGDEPLVSIPERPPQGSPNRPSTGQAQARASRHYNHVTSGSYSLQHNRVMPQPLSMRSAQSIHKSEHKGMQVWAPHTPVWIGVKCALLKRRYPAMPASMLYAPDDVRCEEVGDQRS